MTNRVNVWRIKEKNRTKFNSMQGDFRCANNFRSYFRSRSR